MAVVTLDESGKLTRASISHLERRELGLGFVAKAAEAVAPIAEATLLAAPAAPLEGVGAESEDGDPAPSPLDDGGHQYDPGHGWYTWWWKLCGKETLGRA